MTEIVVKIGTWFLDAYHLPTGYQKIIITNNWDDVGNIDGIPVIHIIDFLTK